MSEEQQLYPVGLLYHNNRYASVLFDVDGDPLRGDSGNVLNVFKEEMKDMMNEGKIRCIHSVSKEPTYIYFVISKEQELRFQREREEGNPNPDKCYHVYPDF